MRRTEDNTWRLDHSAGGVDGVAVIVCECVSEVKKCFDSIPTNPVVMVY